MTNLRKEARGRDCVVRIPGVCNRNPETVVLAHYRLAGHCGTGLKPHDLLAAYACSSCHDCADGRTKTALTREQIRLHFAEGVIRTIAILIREGKLSYE